MHLRADGGHRRGKKELIAVTDGYRESEQSWTAMLLDLKQRGLTISGGDPKLAIADGALGFWAAMRKLWPTTREQRCWVHKTVNVLDKLPQAAARRSQGQAPSDLDGSDERRSSGSVRPVRGHLSGQSTPKPSRV